MAAVLEKIKAFLDSQYHNEENWAVNYKVLKAASLFAGSIFLMRTQGDNMGPYFCSISADKLFGDIVNSDHKARFIAGINISGTSGEVMPGQWELQVGPSVGTSAGDQVWVACYILERILSSEIAGFVFTFDPKPIPGDWNGAGAHTDYSTESMRKDGEFDVIVAAIEMLKLQHIVAYGERCLVGKRNTADIQTFSWGVANRGVSIRVGPETERNGKGYFEDRGPASNSNHIVTFMIANTTMVWKPRKHAPNTQLAV